MGQKVNPIGFRLAATHNWDSRWYAPTKKAFAANLVEDYKIRKFLHQKFRNAAVPRIFIERAGSRVRVKIFTARPGVVIGKKGADLDILKVQLNKLAGKEIMLDIQEVKRPELDAQLVAENIALQIERRISFRRAMKKAIESTMSMGADGIKVRMSGRLAGGDIARAEWLLKGRIPLHTIREDIDYGFCEANSQAGKIGVKCWICAKKELKG
jgi:small subunit ribosomal protein S3